MKATGKDKALDETLRATVQIALALMEVVKASGGIPSGHLYARICDRVGIEDYTILIAQLVQAGLIDDTNYYLTYTGPKDEVN